MDKDFREKMGVSEEQPNDWFEVLYAGTNPEGKGVPWANMDTHPIFKKWLNDHRLIGQNKKALVVGCGMGDDALTLENLGFEVTAFDVAQSAINLCKSRFPDSSINFVEADLIAGIPEWNNKFDFVLEIFTIQALPPKYEAQLIKNLSNLVTKGGELMVITELRNEPRDFEVGPPWLLNGDYIDVFKANGMKLKGEVKQYPPSIGDQCHLSVFQKE